MSLLDSSATLCLLSVAMLPVVEGAPVLDGVGLQAEAKGDLIVDRSFDRESAKIGNDFGCLESMYCQTKKTRSRKLSCGYTNGQVPFQQNSDKDSERLTLVEEGYRA